MALPGLQISVAQVSTQFDEDSLDPGIKLDIPFDDVAEIVFDAENDELDINTFDNTDMWTERRDAPIAWVANPDVPEGRVWSVETHVRYNGAEDGDQRVAGLLFYADEDGGGGSNGGMDFGFGINDWNNRSVELQGFGGTQVGDSGQNFISAIDDIGHVPAAFLRAEIEEGGETDQYTFFYKLEESDPWVELAQLNSDQDNSRVGLFFKNGDATFEEDRSVSFTYLIISDGSDFPDADEDGMSDEYEVENGLDPNDASDRDLDNDGDGLSNLSEFTAGTSADDDDSDDDGLNDGIETDTGVWVNETDTGTDPLNADTDGDGLTDGVETNTGTFVSATDTGTNPHTEDTDGDLADDGKEVAAATDPTDPMSFPASTIGQGAWKVKLDIPNENLASIELDVENNELDFVTNGNTDMWTARRDAPLAWAPNPGVPEGEMWAVETHLRYNGAEDGEQRVAGLLFYPDEDGLGGSNDGLDFGYGLNDWNNRGVEAQGFGGSEVGDSGQLFISAQDDIGNPSSAYLRIEIVEGGDTDEYTFFYKIEEDDEWTELDTINSDQDNSRVAMFIKTGGNTAAEDRSVSFTYFIVDDGSTSGGFRITGITRDVDGVTISWSSRPGAEYSIDSNLSFEENGWTEIDDGIASAGSETTFTDQSTDAINGTEIWYRVRTN